MFFCFNEQFFSDKLGLLQPTSKAWRIYSVSRFQSSLRLAGIFRRIA